MRKLLIAIALAASVGVSGCSAQMQQTGKVLQSIAAATVSQDTVIIARVSFNTAQAVATNYLRLKRCDGTNAPICRDPALTGRIGKAVKDGRAARNRLTALMKQHPGGGVPIADYNTMVVATAVINDLTAAYQAARGR